MKLDTIPHNNKEPLLEPLVNYVRTHKILPLIPKDAVLLDIGCGIPAKLLKLLSPHIKHGIGVDFKVEPCQWDNLQTIRLLIDKQLPFPNDYFDIVTMTAVLEHIEHEAEIVDEIYRILKPNGKLLITVPSTWSQPVLEFMATLKIIYPEEILDHKRYYNRDSLSQLFSTHGFVQFQHQYFELFMNNFCSVSKPCFNPS